MQILQRFRNKTLQRQYARTLGTFWVLTAVHQEAFAQSLGGLSRARTTLQTLKDNLDIILPIAEAAVAQAGPDPAAWLHEKIDAR